MLTSTPPSSTTVTHLHQSHTPFENAIQDICNRATLNFRQITRSFAFFQMIFLGALLLELLLLLLFFPFLTQSSLFAFALAGLVLTAFSYFVLLFYFQGKKPEQTLLLKSQFLEECRLALGKEKDSYESHLSISQCIYRLIDHLEGQEFHYYPLPTQFQALAPLMEKFSLWCHWRDVHQMKELLLMTAIHHQVELIKMEPEDLEAHTALAHSHVCLYQLYLDPRKVHPKRHFPWVSKAYQSWEMQEKFRAAAERALEEFKILGHYAPQDRWVHLKLASVYHDLEDKEQEIKEYETILSASPEDREILFRLGTLYFEQGLNAKGLKIYDQLKRVGDPKSKELIASYDISLTRALRSKDR